MIKYQPNTVFYSARLINILREYSLSCSNSLSYRHNYDHCKVNGQKFVDQNAPYTLFITNYGYLKIQGHFEPTDLDLGKNDNANYTNRYDYMGVEDLEWLVKEFQLDCPVTIWEDILDSAIPNIEEALYNWGNEYRLEGIVNAAVQAFNAHTEVLGDVEHYSIYFDDYGWEFSEPYPYPTLEIPCIVMADGSRLIWRDGHNFTLEITVYHSGEYVGNFELNYK